MKRKHRIFAIFMVFLYLFSSMTVFAAEGETSASSEASTEVVEETTLSAIQTAEDAGCIIEDTSGSDLSLEAGAAVLMEAETGKILYSKNPTEKMYPASITKVLTTLIALEKGNLQDTITFSAETLNAVEQGSSRVGVEAGETCTLEDALHCVMLASGNDTAAGVAEHIAGSVSAFVDMMNEKAAELGCTNTHFTNPHGLPDENHYTTAQDMALIVQAAVKNPHFADIAGDLSYNMPATNKCEAREIWQHHKMMYPSGQYYYEGILWGKTGYTSVALNTLVTAAKKNDITLLTVVLKCPGAAYTYTNSAALFDYGFEHYKAIKPLETFKLKETAATAGISEGAIHDLDRYSILYNGNYTVVAPSTVNPSDIAVSVTTETAAEGIWGSLVFTYQNNEIGRANIYYDANEDLKNIIENEGTAEATAMAKLPFILVAVIILLLLFILFQIISIIHRKQ